MLSHDQVRILNEALDSYEAVIKRRINAEKNDSIRVLLNQEILAIQETRVVSNNPKMVAKQ